MPAAARIAPINPAISIANTQRAASPALDNSCWPPRSPNAGDGGVPVHDRKTGSSIGPAIHPGMLFCRVKWPEPYRSTGKERDNETGLDYFGARYYSGAQGRFTSPDPKMFSRPADPQQWNKYSYVRNNPFVYVDPDGRDLHIVVTNQVVGSSYVNKYTSSEMRRNPGLQQVREKVPTYRVVVTNDSGSGFTTQVTRDTNRNGPTSQTRGDYSSGNEAPPGVYAGATRSDGALGPRAELRDAANPASATISGPDGDRTNVQIHIGPGCSEGCMLLTGGQQGRADFQAGIDDLKAEDKANDNGTAIHIVIADRNIHPIPTKPPDKLEERKD